MRIQRKHVLLTLNLKHNGDNDPITVEAYGSDFDLLPITHSWNKDVETVTVETYLPNTVMLVLKKSNMQSSQSVELVGMHLAGVKINKDIMGNRFEYKPNRSAQSIQSPRQYLELASTQSTTWNHSGCVLFDLFEVDPFAYLLKIRNKIKFS
jgi:hypothetical protein